MFGFIKKLKTVYEILVGLFEIEVDNVSSGVSKSSGNGKY